MLSVYIHIPFCNHICSYCDFPKLLYNHNYINNYLDSLEQEIKERYHNELIDTIYIGGGTPTSLSDEELTKLLNILTIFKTKDSLEYTIESNIESLTISKIKILKQYNINRVSLGVQSFNPNTLKYLNRYHTKDQVIEVINNLKNNDITNINIDLIYATNNDIKEVKEDLNTFLSLDIPHLSYYSLIIEDNTILKINNTNYINEDIEYNMYKLINKTLTNNNYHQYEISNYSKDNYESKHNLNYWHNGNYYGFGLGSVSYLNNLRRSNTKNLTKYLNHNYLDYEEYEDEITNMKTDLILSLRTTKGLSLDSFYHKYHKHLESVYDIKELLKDNILIIKDNYLSINPKYLYLENEIILKII